MFKKLTKALSTGIEKVLEFSQTQISEALLQRYPDFNEVIEVLEKLGQWFLNFWTIKCKLSVRSFNFLTKELK